MVSPLRAALHAAVSRSNVRRTGRARRPAAISRDPGSSATYAEFCRRETLIALNSGRSAATRLALRAGDLIYFRQPGQREPDHLMVFGAARISIPGGDDWVVIPGPLDDGPGRSPQGALSTLAQHPATRWRPIASNPNFVGVFRLELE